MSTYDKKNRLNDQIRKLPYSIIQKLAQFLDDPDDNTMNWRGLIAAMPEGTYTQLQVKQFDKAGMARGGSSTEALLQDMGHKCKTVKQLVAYLEEIGHTQALELLKPEEAVEIINEPVSQVVQEGKKVVIEIKAIGFPPPEYLWLKDGVEFRHGCESKLVFNSVQVKDSGKYTCIVSNPLGTEKSRVAELQVHGTPVCTHPPTIVEHPMSAVIPVGQDYILSCRANEPCNYQWFKDGFELREERSQEIAFNPFKYQDEGNYTCRTFNSEGDALSRIATLQSFTDPQEANICTQPGRLRSSQELKQIAGDKVALVIGNRDYINLPPGESPLVHTCSDAKTLASILRKKCMGFKVISLINLTHSEMNKAIDLFCDMLGENVYGLLYFAGHGFEERGQNYMVPIDAETDWTPDRTICVQEILLRMHAKGTSFHVFLLDICRKMTDTKDAYQMKTYPFPFDAQVVYGFATSPGHEAYERKTDANGLYMKHLVNRIMVDEKVEDVLSTVAADIEAEVADDEYVSRMRPQYHSKTARSYSLMDPIRDDQMSQERNEKWLYIHKLPQKHVLEFQGIKLEIRFEHTNWLSNAILVCLRVLDLGDATMCDANLTHLPKDFQECHFHPATTNILRHVVPPAARTWKIDPPRERSAPVPVERISEIYNIQRLKKNLTLTIELKYVMKGSQEEQTKYEIKAFNLKEFGIAHVFSQLT